MVHTADGYDSLTQRFYSTHCDSDELDGGQAEAIKKFIQVHINAIRRGELLVLPLITSALVRKLSLTNKQRPMLAAIQVDLSYLDNFAHKWTDNDPNDPETWPKLEGQLEIQLQNGSRFEALYSPALQLVSSTYASTGGWEWPDPRIKRWRYKI